MTMSLFSPYKQYSDGEYARLPPDCSYVMLNEGTCSLCNDIARECLHCNPPKLLCKIHYKQHLYAVPYTNA